MRFTIAFVGVLLVFVVLNLAAAQLRSDCGLAAVFGVSYCADDIVRIGFPLQVVERGGFAYRDNFDAGALGADVFIALAVSVIAGVFAGRRGTNLPGVRKGM